MTDDRSAATDADRPSVYDHLRPVDDAVDAGDSSGDLPEPGVYRVVGTGDDGLGADAAADRVTLLRVADAEGRRRNTGELATVAREDLSAFEPVPNPDGDRPAAERVGNAARDAAWTLRAFAASLAARPLASLAAGALVAVGLLADPLSLPEVVEDPLVVGGALALAYLGSRGAD